MYIKEGKTRDGRRITFLSPFSQKLQELGRGGVPEASQCEAEGLLRPVLTLAEPSPLEQGCEEARPNKLVSPLKLGGTVAQQWGVTEGGGRVEFSICNSGLGVCCCRPYTPPFFPVLSRSIGVGAEAFFLLSGALMELVTGRVPICQPELTFETPQEVRIIKTTSCNLI